ncbi:MAG: tRNA (adenosine(37)-N6)-threonylcarbamoyltransferase complex ATPase subunit type 1 TsaE [Armatimonadota bacterium]|nr:tRNA (adenosine(37)-N6)-threonylcarbamoyltransferase complex ATPase subunit type 1 TsaE [bacterium]
MRIVVRTYSADETMEIGERLGRGLQAGDVLALFGDLGAGKTTFTKGIARGLGLEADVHSPTFTLIHEHLGTIPLYHVDLYRLASEEEVDTLGIDEYIYGDGVTIIEWADRMKSLLPPERLDIELKLIGETEREMVFETDSPRLQAVIEELVSNADISH